MPEFLYYIPVIAFWGLWACIALAFCLRIVIDIYNYLGVLMGSYEALEDKEGTVYLRKQK